MAAAASRVASVSADGWIPLLDVDWALVAELAWYPKRPQPLPATQEMETVS